MKSIDLKTPIGKSVVLIGERLENTGRHLPIEKPLIITDTNVKKHWGDHFPPGDVITIETGEAAKTLDTASSIYEQLLERGADRGSFILGIGGGVVCDVAGFVASTYMRGIRFGFVSTTLLSQVDASVGGKNGVNFRGYKNIVGVFNQPEFVICDQNLLSTLPESEYLSGFAEVVKHGAIASEDHFTYLEDNWTGAFERVPRVIEKLVYDSVIIKSAVVNRDATEQGERRKLNFGHTIGHAIEKVLRVSHGEAVSAGMILACRISENKGYLRPQDTARLADLLEKFSLPTRLEFNREAVLEAIGKDKKKGGGQLQFVLLNRIGDALVEEIAIQDLEELIG